MPYASLGNPRTLNLYAYVNNYPTTHLGPDEHAPERAGNYAQDTEMQSDDGLSDEFADTSAQLGEEGGAMAKSMRNWKAESKRCCWRQSGHESHLRRAL